MNEPEPKKRIITFWGLISVYGGIIAFCGPFVAVKINNYKWTAYLLAIPLGLVSTLIAIYLALKILPYGKGFIFKEPAKVKKGFEPISQFLGVFWLLGTAIWSLFVATGMFDILGY